MTYGHCEIAGGSVLVAYKGTKWLGNTFDVRTFMNLSRRNYWVGMSGEISGYYDQPEGLQNYASIWFTDTDCRKWFMRAQRVSRNATDTYMKSFYSGVSEDGIWHGCAAFVHETSDVITWIEGLYRA